LLCQRCHEQGILCGAELWPPKTEERILQGRRTGKTQEKFVASLKPGLPTFHGETITPLDNLYLPFFFDKRSDFTFTQMQVKQQRVATAIIPLEQTNLLESSKTVRSAATALSSFRHAEYSSNLHTFLYLGECYRCVRKALFATFVNVEVIYASYIMFKISLRMGKSCRIIFQHLFGLCKAIHHVKSTTPYVPQWEWEWMEGLLLDTPRPCSLALRSCRQLSCHKHAGVKRLGRRKYPDFGLEPIHRFTLSIFSTTLTNLLHISSEPRNPDGSVISVSVGLRHFLSASHVCKARTGLSEERFADTARRNSVGQVFDNWGDDVVENTSRYQNTRVCRTGNNRAAESSR
jgi:hypothetical protein